MHKYMNKYEQLYIYDKVCVYNGVYEGNIPVSMIHLHTRGLGTHTRGEVHLSLFKSYVNKYSQRAWDLYLHGGPWYFWEDLRKTFIFDLLFKVKKQTDRDMYKKVYNEIPNFMYGNGTYTYVEAHVLFYKTWLIVLLTDARFRRFENSLKVCFERVFCTKKNCIKKEEMDLYSLIFERPMFYFHKTWWMV